MATAEHRERIVLTPVGPFSLPASTRFLEGFTPAGYQGRQDGHLHMALPVEGDWATVGVCVRQDEAEVVVEVTGDADPAAVSTQVARILSLDVDGSGFAAVGQRDPVIGGLQARYPGLRPVCFWSAYEAAAWAIIGHRIRIMQAAKIKALMAERLGVAVEVHGESLAAFPAPERLRELGPTPGLAPKKIEQLRGVADAALKGGLDSAWLRRVPRAEAVEHLQKLAGIGPFSADLILLRGAGEPDHFPLKERRLHHAMAVLYGLDDPDEPEEATLIGIAELWRPYRTWASVLLRVWLEDETHEITDGGRRRSGNGSGR